MASKKVIRRDGAGAPTTATAQGLDGPRARCLAPMIADQSTRVAVRVMLAFSNLETGHPPFALAASSANFA